MSRIMRRPAHLSAARAEAPAPSSPLDLDALFREHSAYVAYIGVRIMGRDADVDDLVQDVFYEAVRSVERLRDTSLPSVRGWLSTVTVRAATRRLRARKLRRWLGLDRDATDDLQGFAFPGATPEQNALIARVYRVLETLPARQRVAWTMHKIEGETLEDVGRALGASLSTVKRWVAAAQERLERKLGA